MKLKGGVKVKGDRERETTSLRGESDGGTAEAEWKVGIHMADVGDTVASPPRNSSIHHRLSPHQNRTSVSQYLLRHF